MENKDSYVGNGEFWSREELKIQSDFICRRDVIKLAGDVTGQKIADIGCGEGYLSRRFSNFGADVIGVDISQTLIERAISMEEQFKQSIEYYVADATLDMSEYFGENSQDLALSICVTPHLRYQEMVDSFKNINKILKKDGRFILGVPHPERYVDKAKSNWWTFDYDFLPKSKDIAVPITLYTGEGDSFKAEAYPHSNELYESAIEESGFSVQTIREPIATLEDLAIFPQRWGREFELPFYMVLELNKVRGVNEK